MAKVICFHRPEEENGYLSNWYPSPFTADGTDYINTEQYMMHKKALLFGDRESAELILSMDDPERIKAQGQAVTNFNNTVWNGMRQVIVWRGLTEKFGQNPELAHMLMGTGDKLLAECAVSDIIWGIGLSMKDERRFDMSKWQGQNLLGFSLMLVREQLRGRALPVKSFA